MLAATVDPHYKVQTNIKVNTEEKTSSISSFLKCYTINMMVT